MENQIRMDDLWVPLFQETSKSVETFLSWSLTVEMSPPEFGSHRCATTFPFFRVTARHYMSYRSVEHSSANLTLWSCHHQNSAWSPCERHSGTDLVLWTCHKHSLDYHPLSQIPETQEDFSCQKYLFCPMSPCFHLPKSAAKPSLAPQICLTFLSWLWTLELAPPSSAPQVTTVPSARTAAPPWSGWPIVPQSKRTTCCSYLWLQCSSQRLSPFWSPESRRESAGSKISSLHATRVNKSQEALPQRLLRSNSDVHNQATPRDTNGFTTSTGQRDVQFQGASLVNFSASGDGLTIASSGQVNTFLIEPTHRKSRCKATNISTRNPGEDCISLIWGRYKGAYLFKGWWWIKFVSAMEHWNTWQSGKSINHQKLKGYTVYNQINIGAYNHNNL